MAPDVKAWQGGFYVTESLADPQALTAEAHKHGPYISSMLIWKADQVLQGQMENCLDPPHPAQKRSSPSKSNLNQLPWYEAGRSRMASEPMSRSCGLHFASRWHLHWSHCTAGRQGRSWLGTRPTVVRAQCVHHQQSFVGGHFHPQGRSGSRWTAGNTMPGTSHAQLNTKPSWESLKKTP